MKRTILAAFTLLLAITLQAQKRVNNRLYNPDPAPVVSGDRLYVFTGHDLDTATYFRMPDWQLFSTTDMEHWTDHGIVLTTANFKWAKQGDNAWASQAIERNGKWYWYVAAEDTTKHLHGIGVAVADRPEGPWTDPIGKPFSQPRQPTFNRFSTRSHVLQSHRSVDAVLTRLGCFRAVRKRRG